MKIEHLQAFGYYGQSLHTPTYDVFDFERIDLVALWLRREMKLNPSVHSYFAFLDNQRTIQVTKKSYCVTFVRSFSVQQLDFIENPSNFREIRDLIKPNF